MENTKNKAQPRPADDIQLDIETVVPSSHEDAAGQISEEKPQHKEDNEQINDSSEKSDQPADDHKDQHTDEVKNDTDDTRDQVETITPDA